MRFVEKVLRGQTQLADIDDFVEQWHRSSSPLTLPEFLGMAEHEYAQWVENPLVLQKLLAARKTGGTNTIQKRRDRAAIA